MARESTGDRLVVLVDNLVQLAAVAMAGSYAWQDWALHESGSRAAGIFLAAAVMLVFLGWLATTVLVAPVLSTIGTSQPRPRVEPEVEAGRSEAAA